MLGGLLSGRDFTVITFKISHHLFPFVSFGGQAQTRYRLRVMGEIGVGSRPLKEGKEMFQGLVTGFVKGFRGQGPWNVCHICIQWALERSI